MTSSTPPNQTPQLLQECQQLLIAISKRPGSTKLLNLVKEQLVVYANYKANRKSIKARK